MFLQCRMEIPLAGKTWARAILRVGMSEPVSPVPGVDCGHYIQLDVSLPKLQRPSLMAGWLVFPESLCWPRGTCHIGNNVSKL